MQLYVQRLPKAEEKEKEDDKFSISCAHDDSIEVLKIKVRDKMGGGEFASLPLSAFNLIFAGKVLEHKYSLADYNIQKESVLLLAVDEEAKIRVAAKAAEEAKVKAAEAIAATLTRIQALKSKYWEDQKRYNSYPSTHPFHNEPKPTFGPDCKWLDEMQWCLSGEGWVYFKRQEQRAHEHNALIKSLWDEFQKSQ